MPTMKLSDLDIRDVSSRQEALVTVKIAGLDVRTFDYQGADCVRYSAWHDVSRCPLNTLAADVTEVMQIVHKTTGEQAPVRLVDANSNTHPCNIVPAIIFKDQLFLDVTDPNFKVQVRYWNLQPSLRVEMATGGSLDVGNGMVYQTDHGTLNCRLKVDPNLCKPMLYMAAVQQDGRLLETVPVSLITVDMCMAAVRQSGDSLQFVPVDLITVDMCLAAVQQNVISLKWVPDKLKTLELCLAAIQQFGKALCPTIS